MSSPMTKKYNKLMAEIEKLKAERDELKAKAVNDLLKYGSHSSDCVGILFSDEDYDVPCPCGFSDVLLSYQKED